MTDVRTPAWHEWRRAGIGATDAVAILGFSRFASPWSVWAEKVGLIQPRDVDSEEAEFGRMFEPAAAPWFHERTGLFIVGEQTWCSHPTEVWARCTPDGFVVEGADSSLDDAIATWEVKAPRSFDIWQEGLGPDEIGDGAEAPVEYQIQAVWQQFVTGCPETYFGVLHGRRFRIYRLRQHGPDIDLVVETCRRFWFDNVAAGVAPPIDGSDATTAALAEAYPAEAPGARAEVSAHAIERWYAAKELARSAGAELDEAKNQLIAALGEAELGCVDDVPAVSLRSQTRKEHVVAESTFRVLRLASKRDRGAA